MISTFLLFLLAAMVALCTERLKAAWCVAACLLYALTVYNLHSEVAGTLSAQDQQACTARKIRKLTLLRGCGWVGSRELVCLCGGGGGSAKSHSPMRLGDVIVADSHSYMRSTHIRQAQDLFKRLELFCVISWSFYPVKPYS